MATIAQGRQDVGDSGDCPAPAPGVEYVGFAEKVLPLLWSHRGLLCSDGSLGQNQHRIAMVTESLEATLEELVDVVPMWQGGDGSKEQRYQSRRHAQGVHKHFRAVLHKSRADTNKLLQKALGDDKIMLKKAMQGLYEWLDTEASALLFFERQLDDTEAALVSA